MGHPYNICMRISHVFGRRISVFKVHITTYNYAYNTYTHAAHNLVSLLFPQ